ncbi:coiled-coil domain-containing protein 117 isoform X2 [Podarcis muralis]
MAALQGAFPGGGAAPPPAQLRPAAGSAMEGLGARRAGLCAPPPRIRARPPALRRRSRSSSQKRRLDGEPDGCPEAKKRLAEAVPALGEWLLVAGQPCGPGLSPQGQSHLPGPLDVPWEEMEQSAGELQCEAARRKLQEIEDRIIDEDEEDESALPAGGVCTLPTLVLSDTLKTGLKRDYEGDLTRQMIESMSRPSMELVLWKPLPEFLTERTPVSVKNFKPLITGRCPTKPAAQEAAFCPQTAEFPEEPQQEEMPSALYGPLGRPAGADEEMEL